MPAVSGIKEDRKEGQQIAARRAELFKRTWLPRLHAFPRVRELLQRFADDGFTIAVAGSAKAKEFDPLLLMRPGQKYDPRRTSSDDASRSKPDPDIVHAALQSTGSAPEQVVMLGDTPYDVKAARRAGLHVVAFECGGWAAADLSEADEIYADAADLLNRYDSSIFSRLAPSRHTSRASGLSASFVQRLSGGASRLAALLLPQILPVFSVVAPCHPGAALRNPLYN